MLNLYGSYDVKPSKKILSEMGESQRRQFLLGEELIESGRSSKGMQVDGRFMTMTEGNAILTYLGWVNRFEKAADEWLVKYNHFINCLERGRQWRTNKTKH